MTARLLRRMASTQGMVALFDDPALVGSMLEFERALATAEAACGVVPRNAAAVIAAACAAGGIDPGELGDQAAAAGTLVIPLVRMLTARVAERDPAAADWVHYGATSQDVADTALVLQLRRALDLLDRDLERLDAALDRLATTHAGTVMLARTLMQPALPTTFGEKVSGWRGAIGRCRARVRSARGEALVLQFGGAAGTLAALGDAGPAVAAALARELDLPLPDRPWHVHRDRLVALASAVAILVGSLGKMARDISLLMQYEVAEAFEPSAPGRGGSSAMPHKHNPVGCMTALAAAQRAPGLLSTLLSGMVQEHERALGGWQAEWPTIPALLEAAAGAAAAMADVAEGLVVDRQAMARNVEAVGGLLLSERVGLRLGEFHGRAAAQEIVREACERARAEGRRLGEVLAADERVSAHLDRNEIESLLDPATYLGVAGPGSDP